MSEKIELRKKILKKALENSGKTLKSLFFELPKLSGLSADEIKAFLVMDKFITEDVLIDFVAILSKKGFQSLLAAISGVTIHKEEVDPKVRVKAWLKRSKIDIRDRFIQELLGKVRPEDDPEEVKSMQDELLNATDEEFFQFFVDNMSEAKLEETVSGIEFFEMFEFEELDPIELLEEQLHAEVVQSDALERVHSDEYQRKIDSIFGTEQDSGETEEELIEQLNSLEYKRDEFDKFAIVQKISPASRQDLEKSIREIKGRLINLQGGTLDRFGLRNRSAVELEHLIEAIQDEIDELKVNKAQTHDAVKKLAEHFKAPPGMSDLFAPTPNRYQLYVKKRLLPELRLNLRLKQTSVKGDTPQDRAARVSVEIQEVNETITLLEQQCEAEVRKYPERAADIKRRYRRAVDAMKETS
jgi:hypothetical protein